MSYTPTQGVFVNGTIVDADDLLNEFQAISVATRENSTKAETQAATAKQEAIKHTDDKFAALNIDGGSF